MGSRMVMAGRRGGSWSQKVFSQDKVGVQQRFVEQTAKRPAPAVWRGSGGRSPT